MRLCGRITLYDYQALCKEYTGSSDSARMLSDVSWRQNKSVCVGGGSILSSGFVVDAIKQTL